MSGVLPPETVSQLFKVCRDGQWDALNTFSKNVLAEGYPVSQV